MRNSDRENQLIDAAKPGRRKSMADTRSKRSPEQREADLALIARLLVRENLTHAEITDKVSAERPYRMTVDMVGYDVKELYRRWRDAYLDDVDVLKGRELRRIDELESAYWSSYERSLKGTSEFQDETTEFTSTEAEKVGAVEDSQKEGVEEQLAQKKRTKRHVAHKFSAERDGEVRFLNGIQWCINKRCEILGLNAPVKAEMTFDWRKEAEREGFNPTIAYNELVKHFMKDNLIDAGEVRELPAGGTDE